MKRSQLFLSLVGVSLGLFYLLSCLGCQSGDAKRQTCETAGAAYTAYQSAVAAGLPQSKEEILAATAAGVFLRTWCGWVPPVLPDPNDTRGIAPSPCDANGVPVLVAPRP